jgi:eukaryotic-like serine/threonine-protein kinase
MTARERYELVGPLGTGGMAEVLLAKRVGPNGFERLLAVKRIRPERAHDPDLVRMLLDEARNAASLVHQRIVQVFDIELREGVVELSMEYLHGRTLDDVLAREPRLSLDAAIAIAIAVADGLHHAHTRAIVHRDVSPSNVMITYDGSVKLIDFGIAKSANNISNTVYGTFKGRLGYSSPEQCRCEVADARTDVYSLAVLLYEMTTGARAFTAATEQDMLARMTEARIAPPSAIDPHFPRDLEAILMKALAPDREHRHATAQAMQQDLEAFARAHALNLSEGALARLMHDLFADALVTWMHARESGVTLEDHVLAEVVRNTGMELEHATHALPPKRRRRSRRPWIPIAVVVALIAVAYAITRVVLTAG